MFCKWCGKRVEPGEERCPSCGRELPPLSECGGFFNLGFVAGEQSGAGKRGSAYGEGPSPEHPWKVACAVLGVVCVILLGALIFSILGRGGERPEPPAPSASPSESVALPPTGSGLPTAPAVPSHSTGLPGGDEPSPQPSAEPTEEPDEPGEEPDHVGMWVTGAAEEGDALVIPGETADVKMRCYGGADESLAGAMVLTEAEILWSLEPGSRARLSSQTGENDTTEKTNVVKLSMNGEEEAELTVTVSLNGVTKSRTRTIKVSEVPAASPSPSPSASQSPSARPTHSQRPSPSPEEPSSSPEEPSSSPEEPSSSPEEPSPSPEEPSSSPEEPSPSPEEPSSSPKEPRSSPEEPSSSPEEPSPSPEEPSPSPEEPT